jgi:MoxR-like ATPase
VTDELASSLQQSIIAPLKKRFVGREEVIDLIALALIAGEHLFLYGPPGTAKSALIRAFANSVDARYFEYLLTRFSEPNELFGPIDLVKLREGTVRTVTTGMLPEAEFVFLDELFNANSAILNNLLTVLNERIYRRGAETHRLPVLSLFSASNHLPEDEALAALFDRFLLRCRVEPLPRESMPRLLQAGWELERGQPQNNVPEAHAVTADDLRKLSRAIFEIELSRVSELYTDLVFKIRDLGIALSDRRAVKVLKLVSASAVLCGRKTAQGSDLWVFRYVWDRDEQIGPLEALIQEFLRNQPTEQAHRLAALPEKVDPELLATEMDEVERQLTESTPSLAGLARLREQIVRLSDQAAWVVDSDIRRHLLDRSAEILEKIGS